MNFESPSNLRWLRYLIVLALVAGVWVFVTRGADEPKNPSLLPSGVTTPAGVEPSSGVARTAIAGFGETTIQVRTADDQLLEWCLLLAMTQAQHQRGLMGVTDTSLGGYDGMLFRFGGDSQAQFYMRNTPMPLSLVYLDAGGAIVPGTNADGTVGPIVDMSPCPDQEGCHLYPATALYRNAIEVPQGGMGRLGIGPGATVIDLNHPCRT